jgi:hypothetical protein
MPSIGTCTFCGLYKGVLRVLTNAGCPILAGCVQFTLVNIDLALWPGEARLAEAQVLIDPVDTLRSVLAGVRFALVNIHFTIHA